MQYSADNIRTAVTGYPRISGRRTQDSLGLKEPLIWGLQKIDHPEHQTEGFGPYLCTTDEQALVSPQIWTDPADMGDYFDPPITAITDRQLIAENNKWK